MRLCLAARTVLALVAAECSPVRFVKKAIIQNKGILPKNRLRSFQPTHKPDHPSLEPVLRTVRFTSPFALTPQQHPIHSHRSVYYTSHLHSPSTATPDALITQRHHPMQPHHKNAPRARTTATYRLACALLSMRCGTAQQARDETEAEFRAAAAFGDDPWLAMQMDGISVEFVKRCIAILVEE